MPYTPILATLAYVMSPDASHVLLVHRVKRGDDLHNGKYNGLGGKLEPGENVVEGVIREVREEAGIECTKVVLRGTINWPGFGKDGEDWFGFVFRVEAFTGTPHSENVDGPLEWVEVSRLGTLPMWEGDKHFLPLVFDNDPRAFHGVMPYDGGKLLSWTFSRL